MSGDVVRIEGLTEVRRGLKTLGDAAGSKELRLGLKSAATLVATEARGRVPVRSGAAAGSIAAGTSGDKAFVAGGRKSVRYYGWLDFGSRTPKTGNPRSKGPWSGSGKGPARGRFIYAAIDAKRAEVEAQVRKAVEALKDRAFK